MDNPPPHNNNHVIIFLYREEVHCDKCYGVPGVQRKASYKTHGNLMKHFKGYYLGKTFGCCIRGHGEDNLKRVKSDIARLHAPDALLDNPVLDAMESVSTLPPGPPVEPIEIPKEPLAETAV